MVDSRLCLVLPDLVEVLDDSIPLLPDVTEHLLTVAHVRRLNLVPVRGQNMSKLLQTHIHTHSLRGFR